jgi:hypothetical protein
MRGFLRGYHGRDRAAEIFLPEHGADFGRAAARTQDASILRIPIEAVLDRFDVERKQRIHGEAVAGELHRRRRRFFERDGSITAQRFNMGRGCCRHYGPQYALRHDIAAFGDQPLDVRCSGPIA